LTFTSTSLRPHAGQIQQEQELPFVVQIDIGGVHADPASSVRGGLRAFPSSRDRPALHIFRGILSPPEIGA